MNAGDLAIEKGSSGPHQPRFTEENEAGTEPQRGNFAPWEKAGGVLFSL